MFPLQNLACKELSYNWSLTVCNLLHLLGLIFQLKVNHISRPHRQALAVYCEFAEENWPIPVSLPPTSEGSCSLGIGRKKRRSVDAILANPTNVRGSSAWARVW